MLRLRLDSAGRRLWLSIPCSVVSLCLAIPGEAQDELTGLSLEELAEVPIVESAKKKQRLFDTAAGAIVFDAEAISRLPASSLPELLRYAPGVHMMRTTNGSWGMGIRGFKSRFLGRSLFSVDDQSLYGGLYAGLLGVQQDLFLDDIESLEIVYGPGGDVWGHNSSNGRINVVLKSAFETEGNLLRAHVGTEEAMLAARSGWSIDADSAIRFSVKASNREPSFSEQFSDDWETLQLGMRFDHRPSSADLLSVSARVFDSSLGSARDSLDFDTGVVGKVEGEETNRGFESQAKWIHQIDSQNGFTARGWTSYAELRSPSTQYDFAVLGFETRARRTYGDRHRFNMTVGATIDDKDTTDTEFIVFRSDYERNDFTAHLGGEYSYQLHPDVLEITLGLTGYHESSSDDIEPLPSARILYSLSRDTRFWASYSRSLRTVFSGINSFERFVFGAVRSDPIGIPTPFGTIPVSNQFITNEADENIEREELNSFEIGYRQQFSEGSVLTINAYHNEYSNLIGGLADFFLPVLTASVEPYFWINAVATNVADGHSEGFEINFSHEFASWFEASLSYAYVEDEFTAIVEPAAIPTGTITILEGSLISLGNHGPENMASAWFGFTFSEQWRADLGLRYTEGFVNTIGAQPSIFQGDLRLTWRPNENLHLSLLGRNLFDSLTDEGLLRDNFDYTSQQRREASIELRHQF